MALDFPANPTNNQEYQGYYWDATEEVWKLSATPPVINIDNLANVDTTGATDGQALVFDAANAQWISGDVASGAEPTKTITSNNIALDFSDGIELEQRAVTGDITFTASNYTSGVSKQVLLQGDSIARNITFPAGWNFIGDAVTKIGANKTNLFTINCFGTDESSVFVTKSGPSAFEPIVATGGAEQEVISGGITYKVHTFTTTANLVVTNPGSLASIDYFIVAGGGAGGPHVGGGGGAGGLLQGSFENVTATTYTAIVGAGGAGTAATGSFTLSGSNSSIFGNIALGGGGGGGFEGDGASFRPGQDGGSGGGAGGGNGTSSATGGAGTAGQGFRGGNTGPRSGQTNTSGAGGGGAAQAATDRPTSYDAGRFDGAPGLSNDWLGQGNLFFAGGGGSGTYDDVPGGYGGAGGGGGGGSYSGVAGLGDTSSINPANNGSVSTSRGAGGAGAANSGGGGGGAGGGSGPTTNGASGGSGIIIIRYPITDPN